MLSIAVVQVDDEELNRRMWSRNALGERGRRRHWSWSAFDGCDLEEIVQAVRDYTASGRRIIFIQDYSLGRAGKGDVLWSRIWSRLTVDERVACILFAAYSGEPSGTAALMEAIRATTDFQGQAIVIPKPCSADEFFALLPP